MTRNVKGLFKKHFDNGDLTELRYVLAVRWENMRVPGVNEDNEVTYHLNKHQNIYTKTLRFKRRG